jgi:hypothetical protein
LSHLNKATFWDGSGKWKPLGSGLGNSSSQILNTVFADGNDIYMGGVFADPLGPPNQKKNFARWNESLDLSGVVEPAEPARTSPFSSDILLDGEQVQVQVSFQSRDGKTYRLQYSLDAMTWTNLGDTITGNGGSWFWTVNILENIDFFRVTEE